MKSTTPDPLARRIGSARDIGELIREKRRSLALTQDELSGLAGVGPRFVSEVERGKETAELGRVLHVLARLGLDVWIVPRGSEPSGR